MCILPGIMHENPIPIIAIDGTTASGKGTIAYRLAQHFGYHYLCSGALYRLTAYVALQKNINLDDIPALVTIATNLTPIFEGKQVLIDGTDVWPIISTQEYGNPASIVSRHPEVRAALFEAQRAMIKSPGLVAEGRDMCTNVFTDAKVKIYLDASVEARAERRYKDEKEKNTGKTLEGLVEELKERDYRDMNKDVGRLYPAEDGVIIDTTPMTIEGVLDDCVKICEKSGIRKAE